MTSREKYLYGIKKLINNTDLNGLTDKHIECVFHILTYAPKINYRHCSPELEGKNFMGYGGAGWFIEDRNE